MRSFIFRASVILIAVATARIGAQDRFPTIETVARQPLLSHLDRLSEAMDYLGVPFDRQTLQSLKELKALNDDRAVSQRAQKILDPFCLVGVKVTSRPSASLSLGPARPILVEQGWKTFLIKVSNQVGSTSRLHISSPNARSIPHSPAKEVDSRWMQIYSYEGRPLNSNLSGLGLEYRIVQLYCRDAGSQQALLEFSVGHSADNGGVIKQWRFDQTSNQWFAMHHSELRVKDGSLHVTSTGNDPYIGTKLTAKPGKMVLRFWANSNVGGFGQVFWWTKEKPSPDGSRRVDFQLTPGKGYLYEVPFEAVGELAGLRIDPSNKPGLCQIDWIELCKATRLNARSSLQIKFQSRAATPVKFRILDAYGKPAFACFEIRNSKGEIFPAQSKRLAPDFFFQKQIYRGDKESILLPKGTYTITCSRGPESIKETKKLEVKDQPVEFFYRVKRWIDPALDGWWSGDHHIHAAGCRHYENPTQGVMPEDMIRHLMGEDLKVGCCLTWGPCFDFQKRFFTGETAVQSRYPYTLRYDVEVSGFGSHLSGHLNLLGLEQQIYPGGESKEHWPTLGLNTLRWAKKQGAICGPAHSAIGLTRFVGRIEGTEGKDGPFGLPNFHIPAYDGIGANEFIMNVTHQVPGPDGKPVRAIDFISAMNTERVAEWNMWYHVLNCGFQVAVSGETDFPCITGDRVGKGRVYAKVDGALEFAKWVKSISDGRSYVSDGSCHLMDFQALRGGSQKAIKEVSVTKCGLKQSRLECREPDDVKFSAVVAARTEDKRVKVELVVNGFAVQAKSIEANGKPFRVEFDQRIRQSSWAAIRVFPHAHTNPIYVMINKKPIRASIDSAKWCLAGVNQCWKTKKNTYAPNELTDARLAFEHARKVFHKIIAESE